MTDPTTDPTVAPRSRGFGRIVAVVLALAAGVYVGARWHAALAGWITGEEQEPVAAASATEQLWTCGMHPQVIQDHPGLCPICHMELTPLAADGAAATVSTAITIDPAVVQNMGIKTAKVTEGALTRTLRAVGTVTEAEPNVHEVNLPVSGWVRRLHADTEGMRVGKHAPLFDLYSPELYAAIEESIRLRRAAPGGDADSPAPGGRGSLYAASLQRLELKGLSSAQAQRLSRLERAPRTVTFTSPISGVVTAKNVVEGSAVRSGEAVLRIVDLNVVWIEAKVFEQHVAAVASGQRITATVAALPGETFAGEVVFVDPYVDPVTRTVVVRLAVSNDALRLRPGMYASVALEAMLAARVKIVPREAVIDTGTRKVAFVARGEGHFEPREIETGVADSEGRIEVIAGLEVGEVVVTSGQFLLDSESRMREAVQKFLREREGIVEQPEPPAAPRPMPPTAAPATPPKMPKRPAAGKEPTPAPAPDPTPERPIYTCPMHPEVRQSGPGSCPICHMDLVPSEGGR